MYSAMIIRISNKGHFLASMIKGLVYMNECLYNSNKGFNSLDVARVLYY